ncbi:MAG: DEAD/DEAH box helicase [Bacteroidetes bacterium]|nr:DEAD/DEAH box helicase [Bacteroidota bacterium]MCY4223896.1 DEAD/DEAH box helicase [Bacteroidota bacterium]
MTSTMAVMDQGHRSPYSAPLRNPSKRFHIPDWIHFEHGPFAHQSKAVNAWRDGGFRGILEMATGSGKTITAMIGAHRLYRKTKPLFIVIAVPYRPLIEQWCDEVRQFGLNPINLTKVGNATMRGCDLQRLRRRLRSNYSDLEVVVVSHDTLCTPKFRSSIDAFECSRLLIADEAHNLGCSSFIEHLPQFFEYRLGLSATPIRQYDQLGTQILLRFFGPIAYQFTLKNAIGRCLVGYDYHAHMVELADSELDQWVFLTDKIRKNQWRIKDDNPDEYLSKLLRDRRAILETASCKLTKLNELLSNEDTKNLHHTLIYTSDKGPDQLRQVNQLLLDRNILFHQLTAAETANRHRTRQIIESFQKGEIQVLTAKRVLDEGINIPQIRKAFILASTTVHRQWIQRRGRLLRTCDSIGKTHSVIHDFLVLPPRMEYGLDAYTRKMVRSELVRVQEFAKLSRNAGRLDGPLTAIDMMVNAAFR